MNPNRFATTPDIGTVLMLLGQRYVMQCSKGYQRDDGSLTTLLRWESRCSECGEAFVVTTSLSIRYLNRRCAKHRHPGRPVATKKAQIKRGPRHG
jgi:hypothetical protein